jgi:RimJ/RimL family protein N-acetyltransferase
MIAEIPLDVFEQNGAALRAYEKIGFIKTLVNMRMDLS